MLQFLVHKLVQRILHLTFHILKEIEISIDITPTCIKIQELETAQWTLLENHHVQLFNLGMIENLHMVKLNATLAKPIAINTKTLLKECKDIFAWNYIDLKGISP